MTPEERAIYQKSQRIRRLANKIITFSELLEDEHLTLSTVDRIKLEAIVNGSALPLAREIIALFDDRHG